MIGDISHIVVIESLQNERETGIELYNDCIIRNIEFRKSRIRHYLHTPKTKEQFYKTLKFYITNSPYLFGGILIHIEMHGHSDLEGLILADGTLLLWSELVDLFRPININTCNKLYLSMATCNGRYLYKGVDAYKKSPYSCYISASTSVVATEIIDQFSLLFEKLIAKGNLITAYLEMEKQGTVFYYKDSKVSFEEAFEVSVKAIMTDSTTREEILQEAREELKKQGLVMPPEESFNYIAQLAIKTMYDKQKKAFDFSDCE